MLKLSAIVTFGLGLALATPLCAQTTPPTSSPDAPMVAHIHARKLILVGDSTMAVHSGWGSAFCSLHVVQTLECLNLARGGRSTLSYRSEGSWDIALREMKPDGYDAVYVLIQMGHNDMPGKPGRSTDLKTEFPANLARFVTEARAAGAIPVLVTPLTRRAFVNGELKDDLEPWAQAVIQVAHDMKVPLVDLHAMSRDYVQNIGPVEALGLAQAPPPQALIDAAQTGTTADSPPAPADQHADDAGAPDARYKSSFDYTHLGPHGAEVFSAMVAKGLAQAEPDLDSQLTP